MFYPVLAGTPKSAPEGVERCGSRDDLLSATCTREVDHADKLHCDADDWGVILRWIDEPEMVTGPLL